MRDLSECKKEVFKRSEIRLKKRRKRKAIMLSLIVPLIAISAVSIIFSPKPSGEKANMNNSADMEQKANLSFQELEIIPILSTADSTVISIKDEEKVEAVYLKINSFFENQKVTGSTFTPPEKSEWAVERKDEENFHEQFLLTFLGNETREYLLEANTLTNQNTMQTVVLSDKEVLEIQEIFQ